MAQTLQPVFSGPGLSSPGLRCQGPVGAQMLVTKAEVPCKGICAWHPDTDFARLHWLLGVRRHSRNKIQKGATHWNETTYPCSGKRQKGLRRGAGLAAVLGPPVQCAEFAALPSEATGLCDSSRLRATCGDVHWAEGTGRGQNPQVLFWGVCEGTVQAEGCY